MKKDYPKKLACDKVWKTKICKKKNLILVHVQLLRLQPVFTIIIVLDLSFSKWLLVWPNYLLIKLRLHSTFYI